METTDFQTHGIGLTGFLYTEGCYEGDGLQLLPQRRRLVPKILDLVLLQDIDYGEQEADKEKSHKGIWWSEWPTSVPGINSGRPKQTRDVWGRFMWKFKFKEQNVRGTDRTYDGTDGTCPWDSWDTHQGVSPKILLFI